VHSCLCSTEWKPALGPVFMEKRCPGQEGHPPSRVNFTARLCEKKVDPFARAKSWQQSSRMLWLSRLDGVDPARRAKVFIWRKVAPNNVAIYCAGMLRSFGRGFKKRRTKLNQLFPLKSCGTLEVTFHARSIWKPLALSKKLKNSQFCENLNDADIISMPMFANC